MGQGDEKHRRNVYQRNLVTSEEAKQQVCILSLFLQGQIECGADGERWKDFHHGGVENDVGKLHYPRLCGHLLQGNVVDNRLTQH